MKVSLLVTLLLAFIYAPTVLSCDCVACSANINFFSSYTSGPYPCDSSCSVTVKVQSTTTDSFQVTLYSPNQTYAQGSSTSSSCYNWTGIVGRSDLYYKLDCTNAVFQCNLNHGIWLSAVGSSSPLPVVSSASSSPSIGDVSLSPSPTVTDKGGSVQVCACGVGSCEGSCRSYLLNQCVTAFDLCDGSQSGYVQVSASTDQYVGDFFTSPDCSGNPVKSFASACGQCNAALNVQVPCSGASLLQSWLAYIS